MSHDQHMHRKGQPRLLPAPFAGMPPENDVTHCWGDSCYFYFDSLTFANAKQKCGNISAVMFSPNTQEEQLEVERYFWTTKYMANYWLGIERQNNRWGQRCWLRSRNAVQAAWCTSAALQVPRMCSCTGFTA